MRRVAASLVLVATIAVAIDGCSPGGGSGRGRKRSRPAGGSAAAGGGGGAGAAAAGQVDPLLQKALDWSRDTQRDHMPDPGVILDWNPNTGEYSGYSDSAIWMGTYAGAEAMRFAVTREPEALAYFERTLWAMHLLQELPRGVAPLCRSVSSTGASMGNNHHDGTGPYAGWSWKGDVSQDQYSGIFFGYGVAWDWIQDPALRQVVRDDVARLADDFIDHDLTIEENGSVTTYGDLNPEYHGVPVYGFSAVLALSFLKVAAHVTGEQRHRDAYDLYARRRGYATCIGNLLFLDLGPIRNYNDYNMAFLSFYTLIGLETDPVLVAAYRCGLERIWNDIDDEQNSFFNLVHASRSGYGPGPRDITDARSSLELLPYPHIDVPVVNSTDPTIAQSPFLDRLGRRQALDPLPVDRRPRGSYAWGRNPRQLDSAGTPSYERYPATAYVLAYWMGRYHGFF